MNYFMHIVLGYSSRVGRQDRVGESAQDLQSGK